MTDDDRSDELLLSKAQGNPEACWALCEGDSGRRQPVSVLAIMSAAMQRTHRRATLIARAMR